VVRDKSFGSQLGFFKSEPNFSNVHFLILAKEEEVLERLGVEAESQANQLACQAGLEYSNHLRN
jgi:hypothetical protein